MNEASFAHDGWFEAECFWCGIPAAVGEKVEIIQYSRREAYWMHPNCARLYVEARGNPKAFVALPPSVVDEYFKRIKRFPDGPSPLDLPSVDLLVVGIMARDDDEPGYAAAVAHGIASSQRTRARDNPAEHGQASGLRADPARSLPDGDGSSPTAAANSGPVRSSTPEP